MHLSMERMTAAIVLQVLLQAGITFAQTPVCSSSMYSSLLALSTYPNVMSFCSRDFPMAAATDITTTITSAATVSTVTITTTELTTNGTVTIPTTIATNTLTNTIATHTNTATVTVLTTTIVPRTLGLDVPTVATTTLFPGVATRAAILQRKHKKDLGARQAVTVAMPDVLAELLFDLEIEEVDGLSTLCSCLDGPRTSTVFAPAVSKNATQITTTVFAAAEATAFSDVTATNIANATLTTTVTTTTTSTVTNQCPSAQPTICPDNLLTTLNTTDVCTSVLTDNLNCGACGHVCAAGSACVNGHCAQASPCDAPVKGIYFCTHPPAQLCVCYMTTEGNGFCDDVQGANDICNTYTPCTTSLNCPDGTVCLLGSSTACGAGVCGKPCGIGATIGNVTTSKLAQRGEMMVEEGSELVLRMPKGER